jgi:hypothetical protein
MFGVLDSSAPFAYMLGVPIEIWHFFTLAAKLAIALIYSRSIRISAISTHFSYLLVIICLISTTFNGGEIGDYGAFLAFCAQLFITLTIVRRENIDAYMRTCVYTICISTFIYLLFFYTGRVSESWGRYNYFGDTHPNLGSEIIGMSIILSTLTFSLGRIILIFIPSIYAISLMQGRAAILASFVALASYIVVRLKIRKRRSVALYTIVPLLIVGMVLFWPGIYTYISSFLFLDDEYRGLASGFVGRDDLWSGAWNYFLLSPIIGNGAGFFEHLVDVYPHNFFLYGLSEFGLLSLPVFGIMFALMFAMFRNDLQKYVSLASISIFWIFNARFININPYPFLFFAVLLAYGNSSSFVYLGMQRSGPSIPPQK